MVWQSTLWAPRCERSSFKQLLGTPDITLCGLQAATATLLAACERHGVVAGNYAFPVATAGALLEQVQPDLPYILYN